MSRPMPLDEPVIKTVLVWVDISYLLISLFGEDPHAFTSRYVASELII
jgi:hypothetical protein